MKTEGFTIEEALHRLPEPYRTMALNNAIAKNLKICTATMEHALQNAFEFSKTEEGYDFWTAIRDHYIVGTPLPKTLKYIIGDTVYIKGSVVDIVYGSENTYRVWISDAEPAVYCKEKEIR